MKSYNAFLKECECSLKLRSLEEDNIEEGFGDFLMGLLGGGASRQLDKMNEDTVNAIKEQSEKYLDALESKSMA